MIVIESTTAECLEAAVRELARHRHRSRDAQQNAADCREIVRQTEAQAALDAALQVVENQRALVREWETEVRELALRVFEETGSKKPHPQVGIRVSTVLDYDISAARNWALANAPFLLRLDGEAFEAMIKGMLPKHAPYDAPVAFDTMPTATISTKL